MSNKNVSINSNRNIWIYNILFLFKYLVLGCNIWFPFEHILNKSIRRVSKIIFGKVLLWNLVDTANLN